MGTDSMHRFLVILCWALFLSGCSVRKVEGGLDHTRAAQGGMRVSSELLEGTGRGEDRPPIPASQAGLQSGMLLSDVDVVAKQSSDGDDEQPEVEQGVIADAEMLDRLLDLLNTDIQDLLNRSIDRASALDLYTSTLQKELQDGKARLRSLQDREEELEDNQRRLERAVRDLRNELQDALKGGEARGMSILMRELTERQQALATSETDLIVTSRLRESFEKILEPLEERLVAIQENNEALVKGVTVSPLPGARDLGVIKEEERGSGRRR